MWGRARAGASAWASDTTRPGRAGSEERIDVKSEVARTSIAALSEGNTPWQQPWSTEAIRPENVTTRRSYRGINRILLGVEEYEKEDPRQSR